MTLAKYWPTFKIGKIFDHLGVSCKIPLFNVVSYGEVDGSQRSWPTGQKLSKMKILAQYHPLGPHLVPNQSKKVSGQALAAFVAKKIIKNVKNREMTCFFRRILKGCRGPDFLSWQEMSWPMGKSFSYMKNDLLANIQGQ